MAEQQRNLWETGDLLLTSAQNAYLRTSLYLAEKRVNLLAIADIFIFIQGTLLAILFLTNQRGNRTQNRLLGLFILSRTLGLLHAFFLNSGIANAHTWLLGFPSLFLFWQGPLLYFYTLSLSKKEFKWRSTYNWFFIPAIIELLTNLVLFGMGGEALLRLMNNKLFWDITGIAHLMASLYTSCFAAIAIILLYRNAKAGRFYTLKAKWIRYSLAYFLTRALLVAVYFSVSLIFPAYDQLYTSSTEIFMVFTGLEFAAIIAISVFSFRHSQEMHNLPKKEAPTPIPLPNEQQLFARLTTLMEQDKLYKKCDLKVSNVAALLNTNVRYVSELVKSQADCSFTQYVNSYRVAEVKRLIADGRLQHLTLTALAEESGFNSKATFNRVFKEMTGVSPNDYRKEMLQAQQLPL